MSLAPGKKPRRPARIAAAAAAVVLIAVVWFVVVPLWEESQVPPGARSAPVPVSISRHQRHLPYSWSGSLLDSLPSYDPRVMDELQVDLRSYDLSRLDLTDWVDDLLWATFDDRTKWSPKLPEPFDPSWFMRLGKNPGLGVRRLHAAGITGEGVGIAIIDQALVTDHEEYAERLKLYEETPNAWTGISMHGPAVASIAAGKTVGVAPGADLYFINACASDASGVAPAVDRVVEVNRSLPIDRKVRVLSMSFTYSLARTDPKHYDEILQAVDRARTAGIFVLSCEPTDMPYSFCGLGRNPLADPDDTLSYGVWSWRAPAVLRGQTITDRDTLLVPMDSRCTASPTGDSDYVFYRQGGLSWTVPYLAGLYALACEVRPDVTPEVFWSTALETGHLLETMTDDGATVTVGRVVDPVALIEKLTGREVVPGWMYLFRNPARVRSVGVAAALAGLALAGYLAFLAARLRAKAAKPSPPSGGSQSGQGS